MGVVLIVVGAGVVIYTEQMKRKASVGKGTVGMAQEERQRGAMD